MRTHKKSASRDVDFEDELFGISRLNPPVGKLFCRGREEARPEQCGKSIVMPHRAIDDTDNDQAGAAQRVQKLSIRKAHSLDSLKLQPLGCHGAVSVRCVAGCSR